MIVYVRVPPEWTPTDAQARIQEALRGSRLTAFMEPEVTCPVITQPVPGAGAAERLASLPGLGRDTRTRNSVSKAREKGEQGMPVIELPPPSLTRSKEMAGGKEWIKQLDSVDTSKKDGFAFTGTFRKYKETVEVPEGTWFLGYYRDMSTSGYERGHVIILWRVQGAGLVRVRRWNLDAGKGWALKVRDEIAGLLFASVSRAPFLEAERAMLLARVKEIDEALGDAMPGDSN